MKAVVTDHAVVRYLQRIRGVDIEAVREEISAIVQPFIDLRAANAVHGPFWFTLDGARVITLIDTKPKVKASVMHDLGVRNGTHMRSDPLPWKGKRRKRGHV